RRSVLGIGATFPDAADTFWTPTRFAEAWASARPPYLLTTREPTRSIVARLPPTACSWSRRRTDAGSTATRGRRPADADRAHRPLHVPGRVPHPARHRAGRAGPRGAAHRDRGHDGPVGGDELVGGAPGLPGRRALRRHAALRARPALRPTHPQLADRAAHPHPGP